MDLLPKEILVEIFSFLPYSDLKTVLSVSKKFLDAGSEKTLWKYFTLFVTKTNISKLEKVLELKTLRDLRRIVCIGCTLTNAQVRLLLQSKVEEVQLGKDHEIENDCNMRRVSPKLLGELIERVSVFKFHNSPVWEMSQKHTELLISTLSRGSRLKKLEIFFNNNLSAVSPDRLGTALTTVTELSLVFQKLNSDKYDAIFYNIYKNSNLLELNLPGNNLAGVNPDLFGSAVTRLRRVNLCDTRLSRIMIQNLLQKMTGDSHLRSLDLSHNLGFADISPQLFSEAMISLTSLNLKMNKITQPQMFSLLSSMTTSRSKLRDINFSGICSLARLEPELVARALVPLRRVEMYACKLTQYQLHQFLVTLGSDGDSLTHLDLGGSNFSSLPPLLISNSLAGLAHLNLYYTKLSTNQMTEVIVGASRSASLQYLDVGANKGCIPKHIIQLAKDNIRTFKMEN